jgi:hypothetical protein
MNSWDDFIDALGRLPAWAQYRAQLRMQDMVRTSLQLAACGVPYPHELPPITAQN